MPNISIVSKESHQVLEKLNSNQVGITENSVVLVQVLKEDVASITRENNNAHINLRNGEVIVLENFFNPEFSDNSLVFEDQDGTLNWVKFTNADGTIADTIQYYPIEEIEPLLYSDSFVGGILPWLAGAGAAGAVVAASNSNSDQNSDSNSDANVVDNVAPNPPVINPINPTSPITGKTEPNAKVEVKLPSGTVVTTADKDGNWTVANPGLKDGDKVEAAATDAAGNTSGKTTATVDGAAPNPPVINPINPTSPITGKTEPNAKVEVKLPSGTVVTTADKDGNWTVANPGLKDGDKVEAAATDAAGNTSGKTTATVDGVAPNPPVINPINPTSPITGKTEPNAKVEVKLPSGTVVTTADKDGNWTVANPGLKDGDKVEAAATDAAGNSSDKAILVVDFTPPNEPTANFNTIGSVITGTAQPLSLVRVKDENNNPLGSATAGSNGQYTIQLSNSLNDGQKVLVTATDAGGESKPKVLNAPNIQVDAVDNVAKAEIDVIYPIVSNTQVDAIKFNWLASFLGLTIGNKSGKTTLTLTQPSTDLEIVLKSTAAGAMFQSIEYKFLKKVGDNQWVNILADRDAGLLDFFGFFPNETGFTATGLEPGIYSLEVINKNAAALFGNIAVDIISKTKNFEGNAQINEIKTANGNVLNDIDAVYGKDSLVANSTVTSVNGININGNTLVKGLYGELTIQSNGSYNYKPNANMENIGKADLFNYTVVDPVTGKSDTAKLIIQIDSKSGNQLNWSKFTPEANANDENVLANESANKFNSTHLNETVSTQGLDKLIYNLLNTNSQNGGHGVDRINDFKLGSNVKIDISNLLSDNATSANIDKFVFVEKDGENTKLSIDRDGTGNTFKKTELMTFNNTDISLQDLLNKNHLLF